MYNKIKENIKVTPGPGDYEVKPITKNTSLIKY
jgi:hypothetical protein